MKILWRNTGKFYRRIPDTTEKRRDFTGAAMPRQMPVGATGQRWGKRDVKRTNVCTLLYFYLAA